MQPCAFVANGFQVSFFVLFPDSGERAPGSSNAPEGDLRDPPIRPETSHPGSLTSESLSSLNLQLSPSQTQGILRPCPLDQDDDPRDVSGASSTKANVNESRGSAKFTSFDFSQNDELEDDLFKESQASEVHEITNSWKLRTIHSRRVFSHSGTRPSGTHAQRH